MSRLYSPNLLVKACQSTSEFVHLQVARSLAFLSKDRESAIKMGQSGTFEAIWLLSHTPTVSGGKGSELLRLMIETTINLVAVPRNAAKLKGSLPLLHLIRIWASIISDQPELTPKLLALLVVLSRASSSDGAAAEPSCSSEMSGYEDVVQEMSQVQAMLRSEGDLFVGQKLLLDALLPLHTTTLLKAVTPKLLNQSFGLTLDVLIGFAMELKKFPPERLANQKFVNRLISDSFTILRDIAHKDFEDAIQPQTRRLMAQAISYFAQYNHGRAELVRPGSQWLILLSAWASSPDPVLRLHTAHALAHLLENDLVGTYVIQEVGLGLIASLTDIVDLDVQNTVARMFGRLRSRSAKEFDSSCALIKDCTLDHEWRLVQSNPVVNANEIDASDAGGL